MPQRNGYKSHRGRSGVARKVMFGGPSTNGMMPTNIVVWGLSRTGGPQRITGTEASYFGGPKKGGSAPSATGFMVAAPQRPYGAFPWVGGDCNSLTSSCASAPGNNNPSNALGGANAYSMYRMNFSLFGPAGGGPLL